MKISRRQIPFRWMTLSGLAAIELVLLFKWCTRLYMDSDMVQNVLEVSDILRGNILLHGWTLALQNYYLSDNPFFLLTRLLFGRTPLAIYAAPFLIFVMFVTTATAIVWFAAKDNRAQMIGLGALSFYLATPSSNGVNVAAVNFFVGAVHGAVWAFCLLAWLALDSIERAGAFSAARGFIALYAVSAFVALFSDPFAITVFLLPTLIGLLFALAAPNRRLIQGSLVGLTLGLFGAARLGLYIVRTIGGFDTVSGQSLQFVSTSDLPRNAAGVVVGLLAASEGYFFGHTLESFDTIVTLIRVAGLGLMLVAMVTALRRGVGGGQGWDLSFVLALVMLIDLCACLVSQQFTGVLDSPVVTGGAAFRYLGPVVLFGAVLVALELPRMLGAVAPQAKRWMVTALCGAGLAASMASFVTVGFSRWNQEPFLIKAPDRVAGLWLLNQGLTHGVGTYWEGMFITALTGEQLAVRAVGADQGQLKPLNWVTNKAWYEERPQFVIYKPENGFGVTLQTINNTYGPPVSIEHVAGYDIALLVPLGK
jgi:hypothetical protein